MLRNKIAICALLSLAPLSGLLAASPPTRNWAKIRSTPTNTIYIDMGSIVARGNLRDVWEKTVENVATPERDTVSIMRSRYDCAKHRGMMLYSESVLKSGVVIGAGIPESQRIWDDIIPTSAAAVSLKFACSR